METYEITDYYHCVHSLNASWKTPTTSRLESRVTEFTEKDGNPHIIDDVVGGVGIFRNLANDLR
jgi:hypothetical protein